MRLCVSVSSTCLLLPSMDGSLEDSRFETAGISKMEGSLGQSSPQPLTKRLTASNSHHHQHQEAQLVIGFYPNRRIQIGSCAKNCPRSCLGVLCVRLGSPHTRPDREPTLPISNPFSRPKAVLQKSASLPLSSLPLETSSWHGQKSSAKWRSQPPIVPLPVDSPTSLSADP